MSFYSPQQRSLSPAPPLSQTASRERYTDSIHTRIAHHHSGTQGARTTSTREQDLKFTRTASASSSSSSSSLASASGGTRGDDRRGRGNPHDLGPERGTKVKKKKRRKNTSTDAAGGPGGEQLVREAEVGEDPRNYDSECPGGRHLVTRKGGGRENYKEGDSYMRMGGGASFTSLGFKPGRENKSSLYHADAALHLQHGRASHDEHRLQASVRELVDEEEQMQMQAGMKRGNYQEGGSVSSSSSSAQHQKSGTTRTKKNKVGSTPLPSFFDPASPAFYEQDAEGGRNVKNVFSYHGIRIPSEQAGEQEHLQQEQKQTSERSLALVVLGFAAVSVGIAVVVLWCDLAVEETKSLHRYTSWCSAGLIDYLPGYYASYSVITVTVLAFLLARHPTVRRAVGEFVDAVRANCFAYRYRQLDESAAAGDGIDTRIYDSPFNHPASHAASPGIFGAPTAPLPASNHTKKKKKHKEKHHQTIEMQRKTAAIEGLMMGRGSIREEDDLGGPVGRGGGGARPQVIGATTSFTSGTSSTRPTGDSGLQSGTSDRDQLERAAANLLRDAGKHQSPARNNVEKTSSSTSVGALLDVVDVPSPGAVGVVGNKAKKKKRRKSRTEDKYIGTRTTTTSTRGAGTGGAAPAAGAPAARRSSAAGTPAGDDDVRLRSVSAGCRPAGRPPQLDDIPLTPNAEFGTPQADLYAAHALHAGYSSPVYSDGAGWASCGEEQSEGKAAGGAASSDESWSESSSSSSGGGSSSGSSSSDSEDGEGDDGGYQIRYNDFLGLRTEVREQILKEIDAEKISQIRSLILDLDRGAILKFHPEMTRDKVLSFCKFFGGAECGCLRFLKVTSWNKVKAMDRITRATLWRLYEVPRLRQQSRDVLDEFNANPKEAVFPCVGSYYLNRQYQAHDGSPIELWRCSKINFNKLFQRYSEKECEHAYVNYVLRKEETCRRCRAQGIFALIDCKGASVSAMVWQTSKLRIMTNFMGKYGEQFFPDSISSALVYNAPKGADFIWKLFSAALSEATRNRVRIVSGSGREEIAELMDLRVVEELESLLPD